MEDAVTSGMRKLFETKVIAEHATVAQVVTEWTQDDLDTLIRASDSQLDVQPSNDTGLFLYSCKSIFLSFLLTSLSFYFVIIKVVMLRPPGIGGGKPWEQKQ